MNWCDYGGKSTGIWNNLAAIRSAAIAASTSGNTSFSKPYVLLFNWSDNNQLQCDAKKIISRAAEEKAAKRSQKRARMKRDKRGRWWWWWWWNCAPHDKVIFVCFGVQLNFWNQYVRAANNNYLQRIDCFQPPCLFPNMQMSFRFPLSSPPLSLSLGDDGCVLYDFVVNLVGLMKVGARKMTPVASVASVASPRLILHPSCRWLLIWLNVLASRFTAAVSLALIDFLRVEFFFFLVKIWSSWLVIANFIGRQLLVVGYGQIDPILDYDVAKLRPIFAIFWVRFVQFLTDFYPIFGVDQSLISSNFWLVFGRFLSNFCPCFWLIFNQFLVRIKVGFYPIFLPCFRLIFIQFLADFCPIFYLFLAEFWLIFGLVFD